MSSTATSILIANRGEIAIRVARAAAELRLRSVAVHSQDDAYGLHRRIADADVALDREGPAAYLDIDRMIAVARDNGCDAVHPGYGFLSENAGFARLCEENRLTFIGPRAEHLELFGDKGRARLLAKSLGIPVPAGTDGSTTLEQAQAFMNGLGPGAAVMIKAIAGGGGRGMRLVERAEDLAEAYARCRSEAQTAFGVDEVYVESVVRRARHIEIQLAGDGRSVVSLGERDCSVQRRHQKVVEIAPSPSLTQAQRTAVTEAALKMARAVGYRTLGTFEFLVDLDHDRFAFIEANPRLQVEHTVTEAVMGVDLVKLQIRLAQGASLEEAGLPANWSAQPRGYAIQLRVNLESRASSGLADVLTTFDMPGGPGVRIDTAGYTGYAPSPNFDALLAKVVVHDPSNQFADVVDRAYRAVCECRIEGVATNLRFLRNLLIDDEFRAARVTTRFADERAGVLDGGGATHPSRFFERAPAPSRDVGPEELDDDPALIVAPLRGSVLLLEVKVGDTIRAGQQVAVLEAMKMEHEVLAPIGGVVTELLAAPRDVIGAGAPIARIQIGSDDGEEVVESAQTESGGIRADLQEVIARYARTQDAARPVAVSKRRKTGQRTARENLADLCDPGSFMEYGALAVAGQRARSNYDTLLDISPADGFIYGLATVNAELFGEERSRCMVATYDYTVFAGTQGFIGHKKHDRMFVITESARLPVVIFTEGGGGRPYDSDNIGGVNLANPTFWHFARLSGLVPLVGIASGRCFAGNAALLGCCDVVIATRDSTLGMGGPAMIEGAGLGVVSPEEVGPARMHFRQGVVDILVADEAQAVAAARKYLAYFQGPMADWTAPEQTALRDVIPQRRTRAYDIRRVVELLADDDSVLELRAGFGIGAVTALIRIEGRPMGLIANNPMHQAGALGADESDKIARFIQMCDAFDLPIVSLCDTPGIMVGTEAERTALVRHASRVFVNAANITVPFFTIVLRKAYGLGAMAMGGGSFHQGSFFSVSWPTGEFGSMGFEGQIRLGYRAELAAIEDEQARQARFQELVDGLYAHGKALNVAPFLSIDAVIDPAESRHWIMRGLRSFPPPPPRTGRKRANVDTW